MNPDRISLGILDPRAGGVTPRPFVVAAPVSPWRIRGRPVGGHLGSTRPVHGGGDAGLEGLHPGRGTLDHQAADAISRVRGIGRGHAGRSCWEPRPQVRSGAGHLRCTRVRHFPACQPAGGAHPARCAGHVPGRRRPVWHSMPLTAQLTRNLGPLHACGPALCFRHQG